MCALCVGVCVAHSGRKVCYNGIVNKQKGKTMNDNSNSQKNSIGKLLDKYELVLGAFMWGVAIGIALYRIPQLFALGIW